MAMVSTTGLHVIRALAYLAMQPKGTKMSAALIAAEVHAPANYLGKLLQTLANEGLLHSQKGHGGGFSLARSAEKISLYDVLDPIERLSSHPACFFGWKRCQDKNPCSVHAQWGPQRDSFYNLLKTTTINQISQGEIFEK